MSNIWFCSDLHFGHKNIGSFRSKFDVCTEEENRNRIKNDWNSCVTKRDIVYILGDAAFTMETVSDFSELMGKKILIRGNHDLLNTQVYLKYFDDVYGFLHYKEFWLSHPPIHPDELRGGINLHGHVHYATVKQSFNPIYDVTQKQDTRYFNCCPENLWPLKGRCLINLQEIRETLSIRC